MRDRLIPHNEFQYDKWQAFVHGRTGEQQIAWERRMQRLRAAKVVQAMNDDPVLALMRDIERLRSALREMTEEAQAMGNVLEEDLGKFPFDAEVILRKHGVAQLMRADDTPQSPGWSGDGD